MVFLARTDNTIIVLRLTHRWWCQQVSRIHGYINNLMAIVWGMCLSVSLSLTSNSCHEIFLSGNFLSRNGLVGFPPTQCCHTFLVVGFYCKRWQFAENPDHVHHSRGQRQEAGEKNQCLRRHEGLRIWHFDWLDGVSGLTEVSPIHFNVSVQFWMTDPSVGRFCVWYGKTSIWCAGQS